MSNKRQIEIYSAGCAACDDVVALVNSLACPSCEVIIRDMHDAKVAARAQQLGIRSVPAVVVDGKLADCCAGRRVDADTLRAAGVGQAP